MATIRVFELGDEFVFTHYFDGTDAFTDLSDYYDDESYRFEIPAREFESVRETLKDHGHDFLLTDDPDDFCVVVERYEPHAVILRDSVVHWSRRDHEFFLMKDEAAVEKAIREGATPIEDTEFSSGL